MEEHGFWVDTQARCLRKDLSGLVIPFSIRSISSVTVLDLDLEPLKDGTILLIIDASERYSSYAQCFSTEQAASLPEHKSWDHKITQQDPNVRNHDSLPLGCRTLAEWHRNTGGPLGAPGVLQDSLGSGPLVLASGLSKIVPDES